MDELSSVDCLNDAEIQNLVSFLVGQEDAFEDLHKLHLPVPEAPPPNSDPLELILPEPHNENQMDIDEINELLIFHDALDYQPLESLSPLFPLDHAPQLTPRSDDTPTFNYSTESVPTSPAVRGVESLRAGVHHDHTYSAKEACDRPPQSAMLTPVGSDLSCDLNGRVSDDNEEGNSSDGGYDTMTSSSPNSTKSDCKVDAAGTTASPVSLSSSSPPLTLSSLSSATADMDPVKLIDERIKFFMSRQQVHLTEEEKETLRSEGLPIPTTLPLTKTEEKALKTVRRKIRNKIAAQESRTKKKKYMESLEDRLKYCTEDNRKLMKKVETLETENHTLKQQLLQLQALVARATTPILGRPIQLGSCLMVVVLCFGILFGNLLPYKVSLTSDASYTAAATVRSRALLSVGSAQQDNWLMNNWKYFYKSLLPGNVDTAPPTADWSQYNYKKLRDIFVSVNLLTAHHHNETASY